MNHKGFTLIELIATIALLGVIFTISFVSISKMIDKSHQRDCETLVGNIKSAASNYVTDNRYNSLFISTVFVDEEGDKSVNIDINTLTSSSKPYLKGTIPDDGVGIVITVKLYPNYTVKKVTVGGITCGG